LADKAFNLCVVCGLWKFKVEQKICEIGGVRVGGNPGERPAVLVGSIFYHKHKIVTDETKGEFDKKKAEELINLQDDFSERTGNPCMVDVVGSKPSAMAPYLDFVANKTHVPMLLGGTTPEVRVAGLKYAKECGLTDRLIYNSLTPDFKPEELKEIREAEVNSVLLLAYYMRDFTSEGRVTAIREMVNRLQGTEVKNILVDTCVIDLPSFGQALQAIYTVKDEMGLPTGCGAHNATSLWRGLKVKMGDQAVKPCLTTASTTTVSVGGDFVLYGPIGNAKYIFPAVAMVDTAYSQLIIEKGKPLDKKHPRYRIS
jgi:tetrahydromethanopterin S-methyltransferase subunit H